MFLLLLITVSIVAVLIFMQFNKKQDKNLIKFVAGVCFAFSWVAIVVWFTSLVEVWQIALNTPEANNESIPVWSHTVLSLLREAVYLLPISRLTLGALYASPILLIPMVLVVVKRSQLTLILMFSTLVNLLFFWLQVIVDSGIPSSLTKVSVQGVILLMMYILAFIVLILQRPLSSFLIKYMGMVHTHP